jgi:zinc transporter ZupT
LILTVWLSGMVFLLLGRQNETWLRLSLSFSGAFLFTISIIHLLPSLLLQEGIRAGYFVLAGFFLQIVIEFFSGGIEHGHIHSHLRDGKTFPFTIMAGLSFHSFLEGMPLEGHLPSHADHSPVLLTGIILHHMPVAFALMSMLIASGLKRWKASVWLFLFALMAPLGALTSRLLTHLYIPLPDHFFNSLMAIVVGIFMHISTTILFESNKDHRFNLIKMITVLSGAAVALLLF